MVIVLGGKGKLSVHIRAGIGVLTGVLRVFYIWHIEVVIIVVRGLSMVRCRVASSIGTEGASTSLDLRHLLLDKVVVGASLLLFESDLWCSAAQRPASFRQGHGGSCRTASRSGLGGSASTHGERGLGEGASCLFPRREPKVGLARYRLLASAAHLWTHGGFGGIASTFYICHLPRDKVIDIISSKPTNHVVSLSCFVDCSNMR